MNIIDWVKKQIQPFNSLFSLLTYSLFAIIYTFPLIFYYKDHVAGDLEGDVWKHVWGFWWVKKTIFVDRGLPLFTELLKFPYGGALVFIDQLGAFLSMPLQFLSDLVVAYNLLLFLNIVFSAYCAYILTDYFVKNQAAAFVGGAIFGFTPYMLIHITSGVSETFNMGWIPLFLYFYLRMLNEKDEKFPILAGFSLAMASMGSWYYGSYAVQFGVFVFLFFAYYQYKKVIGKARQENRQEVYIWDLLKEKITENWLKIKLYLITHERTVLERNQRNIYAKKPEEFSFLDKIVSDSSFLVKGLLGVDILFLLMFPLFVSNFTVSMRNFDSILFTAIMILILSTIFLRWQYRKNINQFTQRFLQLYYSLDPRIAKRKMYILFGFYMFSILGMIHFNSVLHQDTSTKIFYVGLFTAFCLLISLILTYMELKPDKSMRLYVGNFATYSPQVIPWIAMGLGIINVMRIIFFYQDIVNVFDTEHIRDNIIMSVILLLLALYFIIRYKIYEKSATIQQLFINPDLPPASTDPHMLLKVRVRNIIITLFAVATLVISPITFLLRGFPPEEFGQVWLKIIFIPVIIVFIIYYLFQFGRSALSRIDEKSKMPGIVIYLSYIIKDPLRKILIMSIIAMALVQPFVVAFQRSSSGGTFSMVTRERSTGDHDLKEIMSSERYSKLSDYVLPGKQNLIRTYTADRLCYSSYAGLITLFMVIMAVAISRKRKYFWYWLSMAVLFTLFSLGPYPYLTSNIQMDKPFFLYKWFFEYFPMFSYLSIPMRFNICAMLAFAVLTGFSFCHITRKWRKTDQILASLVLSMAILFEILIFSPAPYPVPISNTHVPVFYHQIAQDQDFYGILDIPFQRTKGELVPGEYYFYQTVHNKGIPYHVEGTIPFYVYQNQFTMLLFNLEKGHVPQSSLTKDILKQYLNELKKNKFKYIVVHNNSLQESSAERLHIYLEYFIGKPTYYKDDNIYVYKIY